MNRKELAIIAVVILLTVIAWIAFGVYSTRNKLSISQKELRQVVPLTPNFDNEIIKKLSNREE